MWLNELGEALGELPFEGAAQLPVQKELRAVLAG